MSKIATLQELYVDELKDLWSANDQMAKALTKITPHATDAKLKKLLSESQPGIAIHTELLKTLIEVQRDGEKGALQGHGRPCRRGDQTHDR